MNAASTAPASPAAQATAAGPQSLGRRPALSAAGTLALLAVWLLALTGLRPLLLPDEGRYVGVARDMLLGIGAPTLADGRGWVPLLNGLPFFHKPPLMYWLDMAAMAVFGVNQFAARFAPFVGAWLMGASLFLALRRWHDAAVAQRALLVLASTPFFFIGGQYANLDMLVGGLITATVLAFVRAVDGDAPARQAPLRWLLLAWALAALGVLAKGLIGIVLPMLVVGPWLLAQQRWRCVARLLHPAGLAVFAAIALPWMLAMQSKYPGFFDYFIVEQHFRRFASATFNNVHPAWFYLLVLPALTLPWALWLPAAAQALRRGRTGLPAPHTALFLWWVVVIVGFFSLPSSKLVGYVLPALAPWCALLALGTGTGAGTGDGAGTTVFGRFGPVGRATLAAAVLLCVGVAVALAVVAPHSTKAAGRALAAQWAPGDRVVFVDEMFYDLPFYAGLRQPVTVASDWADPQIPRRDNWRKELADAARFDPARGRELLWPIGRLAELTCQRAGEPAHAVWFVVNSQRDAAAALPGVAGAVPAHADKAVRLLRAPTRACPP